MREAALTALKTQLQNITEDNGYPVTVKAVRREYLDMKDIPATQIPLLVIEDDGEEEILYKTGDFADVLFQVNIRGYVNSIDGLSTPLNVLDVAAKKAIGQDLTLGGNAFSVTILPYTDRSGNETTPFAFFVRPIRITYEGRITQGM